MIKIMVSFITGFIICLICVSIWAGIAVNYVDDSEPEPEHTAILI